MVEWRSRAQACIAVLALTGAASFAAPAVAVSSVTLDEHVNRLTSELRCLVCQNQTVADSQAELALQLKNEVRQQLARGATDDQVKDFMVQRYGDFILYRPRLNQATLLLWMAPLLLLLVGAVLLGMHWRERRALLDRPVDSAWPEPDDMPTTTS